MAIRSWEGKAYLGCHFQVYKLISLDYMGKYLFNFFDQVFLFVNFKTLCHTTFLKILVWVLQDMHTRDCRQHESQVWYWFMDLSALCLFIIFSYLLGVIFWYLYVYASLISRSGIIFLDNLLLWVMYSYVSYFNIYTIYNGKSEIICTFAITHL
jgi:hypothetical protein